MMIPNFVASLAASLTHSLCLAGINAQERRQSFFLLLLLDIIVPYSHNTNQPCSSFLTILTNGGGSG